MKEQKIFLIQSIDNDDINSCFMNTKLAELMLGMITKLPYAPAYKIITSILLTDGNEEEKNEFNI